jgi:hypothetical protein
MQHGISDGARQKQMRLSTILAFAPSSYSTSLAVAELGQHFIVPQEALTNMQLAHPSSHLSGVIVCPSKS